MSVVHAAFRLSECFSFGLCSCLKGVALKDGKFGPTWLHCDNPAQVTARHDDAITPIPRLPLSPWVMA